MISAYTGNSTRGLWVKYFANFVLQFQKCKYFAIKYKSTENIYYFRVIISDAGTTIYRLTALSISKFSEYYMIVNDLYDIHNIYKTLHTRVICQFFFFFVILNNIFILIQDFIYVRVDYRRFFNGKVLGHLSSSSLVRHVWIKESHTNYRGCLDHFIFRCSAICHVHYSRLFGFSPG